jgi:uncharacterized membrane protein
MSRRRSWLAFVVFAGGMGTLSLLRYATYHSRSLDMAYYVRLVWGIAHGYWDQPVVGARHLLGLHLEPILLPFALLARLGLPVAETLLVAQALLAAAAIFPAAALAKRRLAPLVGEGWAFAAALSIYLLPTVSRCVDYDVHPSTMALWPLLAFVNALDEGRLYRASAWLAFSLAFREDIGLQVAAVALTFLLFPRAPRERAWAATITLLGLAWFFGYTLLVQPHWLPDTARSSYGLHFRPFSGGHGGVAGVLRSALTDPMALARYLASGDRLFYPLLLLLPVALLPLAAPRYLVGALPLVAINLLSDLPGVRTVQAHYITAAAPFLCASALCGAARVATWLPRFRRVPPLLLVSASLVAFLVRGASPLSPEWRWSAYLWDESARRARAETAGIPDHASVTAPSRVLAHVATRRHVYHPKFAPSQVDVRIE